MIEPLLARELTRDDPARRQWDAFGERAAAACALHTAAEASAPDGFRISALGVFGGDRLLAAAPMFETVYRVDTSLPPAFHPVAQWVEARIPRLVALPLVGLGSPMSDRCDVVFAPHLDDARRAALWPHLLEGLEAHRAARRARLVAVKDLDASQRLQVEGAFAAAGFTRVPSLPVAVLNLADRTEAGYLGRLPASVRSDLRRKLRQSESKVRFELRDRVADIEGDLAELYEMTRQRRRADYGDFDALPRGYFDAVLGSLGTRARVVLGWAGNELASFNLFTIEPDRVTALKIGMRYPLARELNLYFLNWMMLVRFCAERGIARLEMGQTSYRDKLRLGCRLEERSIYFRHTLSGVNRLMRCLAPLGGFDKLEAGAR